jgi:hypothetical protein
MHLEENHQCRARAKRLARMQAANRKQPILRARAATSEQPGTGEREPRYESNPCDGSGATTSETPNTG